MLLTHTYGLEPNVPQAISDLDIKLSDRGWDSCRQKFLVHLQGVSIATGIATHFPSWAGHGSYANMFQMPVATKNLGGSVWEFDVEWQGEFADRGYRREIKCFGETSSGENIYLSAGVQALGYPGFVKKFKLEQLTISVETVYITGSVPSLLTVKQPMGAATLPAGYPALPTAPTSFWTSIVDPTWVYPAGWLLDNREPKRLGGASLYEVTDRHVFRHSVEI
jgi:hypothetical protein